MISCSEIVSEEEVVFLLLCLVKMLHLRLLEPCVSLQNHKGRKSVRVTIRGMLRNSSIKRYLLECYKVIQWLL